MRPPPTSDGAEFTMVVTPEGQENLNAAFKRTAPLRTTATAMEPQAEGLTPKKPWRHCLKPPPAFNGTVSTMVAAPM